MRQSMQAPCPFLPEAGISQLAGGIAPAQGSLPSRVTPWATTSREAPPIPLQGGGPKTNTAASRSPYGLKQVPDAARLGIQRTKQFRQCLRHRHAALHEDRVNPDYTIARSANPPPSGCGKTPARHNRLNIETAPPHAAAIQPCFIIGNKEFVNPPGHFGKTTAGERTCSNILSFIHAEVTHDGRL